jgi:hypothetical protein
MGTAGITCMTRLIGVCAPGFAHVCGSEVQHDVSVSQQAAITMNTLHHRHAA